mgnify:CR=1 FL=1
MQRQNVRVLLASENPATRSILRRIVETEDKAVIVAEAENGTRALNLARSLRPDVALIDNCLPSVVGLDNIPLSRAGGLDVAQSISEEIPNMHVVLLNSLNDRITADSAWRNEYNALLCRDSKEACIPFTLGELSARESAENLIFANIKTKAGDVPEQKTRLSDKVILTGILGVVAGWLMILTMFLATVGLYVVLAGITTALFGLIGKRVSKSFK